MLYHLLANIPILIYVSCYFYEIKGNVKITYTIVYSVSCVTLCFLVHSFKGGYHPYFFIFHCAYFIALRPVLMPYLASACLPYLIVSRHNIISTLTLTLSWWYFKGGYRRYSHHVTYHSCAIMLIFTFLGMYPIVFSVSYVPSCFSFKGGYSS